MNMPEGWKLVPVEMTAEMKSKAQNRIDLVLRVGLPEYDLTDGVEMAWNAALEAAPTPPAVEPVGFLVRRRTAGAMTRFCQIDELSHWQQMGEITFLYTHPANDGLRKAAEEFMVGFDRHISYRQVSARLQELADPLRAELAKLK